MESNIPTIKYMRYLYGFVHLVCIICIDVYVCLSCFCRSWFFWFVISLAMNCSYIIYLVCCTINVDGFNVFYVLALLQAIAFGLLSWALTATIVRIYIIFQCKIFCTWRFSMYTVFFLFFSEKLKRRILYTLSYVIRHRICIFTMFHF